MQSSELCWLAWGRRFPRVTFPLWILNFSLTSFFFLTVPVDYLAVGRMKCLAMLLRSSKIWCGLWFLPSPPFSHKIEARHKHTEHLSDPGIHYDNLNSAAPDIKELHLDYDQTKEMNKCIWQQDNSTKPWSDLKLLYSYVGWFEETLIFPLSFVLFLGLTAAFHHCLPLG